MITLFQTDVSACGDEGSQRKWLGPSVAAVEVMGGSGEPYAERTATLGPRRRPPGEGPVKCSKTPAERRATRRPRGRTFSNFSPIILRIVWVAGFRRLLITSLWITTIACTVPSAFSLSADREAGGDGKRATAMGKG